MQDLLERQNVLIKEIERVYTNFKKDPLKRKTAEYFEKRLEALDNLWGEFKLNNSKLQKFEDKSSDYFVQNIMTQMEQYYQKARENMEASASTSHTLEIPKDYPEAGRTMDGTSTSKFEVPSIADNTSSQNSKADELLVQQYANFRAIERQIKRINSQNIEEKWEIEDELKNLQHRWRIIDELHLRIDGILSGNNKNYDEQFTSIENKYTDIKRVLNKKLCSTAHLQQSLPQIDIPVFTGKYTQWPTFCELYTEAIHNNKYLTNAQKMQHLKGKLKGEAERLIQHLHISADNYETAWEILDHRYNNPHFLLTKQVEVLLNQSNIHKQSSFELKRLYDTTTECIHAIHNLGVDTNSWDPLLVHLLSKKLDSDTYSDYKESRKEPRKLPALEEFMSFIEAKFTALEPIQRREKEPSAVAKPTYQTFKPPSFYVPKPSTSQGYQSKPYRRGFYQAAPTKTVHHMQRFP